MTMAVPWVFVVEQSAVTVKVVAAEGAAPPIQVPAVIRTAITPTHDQRRDTVPTRTSLHGAVLRSRDAMSLITGTQ